MRYVHTPLLTYDLSSNKSYGGAKWDNSAQDTVKWPVMIGRSFHAFTTTWLKLSAHRCSKLMGAMMLFNQDI
jgi:hypothetical protein